MNGEGAVSRAPEDVPTSASSIALRTDNYPVTGALVVDLTVVDLPWPEFNHDSVRFTIWAIEQAPRGALVRLRVGKVPFMPYYVAGIDIRHVSIEVEADSVVALRRWVQGLREARA